MLTDPLRCLDSRPHTISTRFDPCRNASGRSPYQTIKSLSFSECGRFVLATTAWSTDVVLLPDDQPEGQPSFSRPDTSLLPRPLADQQRGLDVVTQNSSSGLISRDVSAPLRPGESFTGTRLLSANTNGSEAKALIITISGQNVAAESQGSGSNTSTENALAQFGSSAGSLQLLSLPSSFKTDNTAVSVRVPMCADDTINIVFNKTLAGAYSLSPRNICQFPTVIDRSSESICQVTQTRARGRHKAVGNHDYESNPKRLKLELPGVAATGR